MKKIKVQLEYRCFPIWLYDENGNLIDNDFPASLIGDPEIDPILYSYRSSLMLCI